VKKKKKKQEQREEEKSRLFPIFVCGFQNHLCSITCWTYIKLVICCALNRTINQCWLAVAVAVVVVKTHVLVLDTEYTHAPKHTNIGTLFLLLLLGR